MNTYGYPTHMSDRHVRNDQAREYVRELTREELIQDIKEIELDLSNKAKIKAVIQATKDSSTQPTEDPTLRATGCGQDVVCPGLPERSLHGH